MSPKDIEKWSRRNALKLAGASALGLTVAPTVGATGGREGKPVRAIKASIKNPIQSKHIEREREVIFDHLRQRDDTPQSVVVDGDPTSEDRSLVGYAITVENGAPVERTYSVSESGGPNIPERDTQVMRGLKQAHHRSVDSFVARHAGGK